MSSASSIRSAASPPSSAADQLEVAARRSGTGRSAAPRRTRRRRPARAPPRAAGRARTASRCPRPGRIRPSSIRSDVVLPGAVGPEVAVDVAGADGQVDVVDRRDVAVALDAGRGPRSPPSLQPSGGVLGRDRRDRAGDRCSARRRARTSAACRARWRARCPVAPSMLTWGSVSAGATAPPCRSGLGLEHEDRAQARAVDADGAGLRRRSGPAARCGAAARRARPGAASGKSSRFATSSTPSTWVGLPFASTPAGGSISVTFAPAGGVASIWPAGDLAVGDVGGLDLEHRVVGALGVDRRAQRHAADGVPGQLERAEQPAVVLGGDPDRVATAGRRSRSAWRRRASRPGRAARARAGRRRASGALALAAAACALRQAAGVRGLGGRVIDHEALAVGDDLGVAVARTAARAAAGRRRPATAGRWRR